MLGAMVHENRRKLVSYLEVTHQKPKFSEMEFLSNLTKYSYKLLLLMSIFNIQICTEDHEKCDVPSDDAYKLGTMLCSASSRYEEIVGASSP